MSKIELIEVFMADAQVGRLAITPDGVCAFEYTPEYLRTGVSISPFYLPLQSGLIIAKHHPFNGDFGVFHDSLPDGWGNLLLDRYLKEKGIDPYRLTVLERLSLIGTSGKGALEYRPSTNIISEDEYLDFNKLAAESEKILNSDYTGDSLNTLYQYGGSSGGARPKVFVKIENKEWLVKFKATNDPKDIGVIEYQYSLLAKECGINMPETKLFENKYFGVERFDRTLNGKVHTISAAGLLHADYRIPSLDYATLLKACLILTKDMTQVCDLFRLMVFNIIISNKDDHAKNFSFQLINNEWKLSPAYDILPSTGFNGYHTTTINGKGEPNLSDVKSLAKEAGITNQQSSLIIDEIIDKCSSRKMIQYRLK